MLSSPSHAVNRATIANYLYNLDASCNTQGAPPHWCTTTVPRPGSFLSVASHSEAPRYITYGICVGMAKTRP